MQSWNDNNTQIFLLQNFFGAIPTPSATWIPTVYPSYNPNGPGANTGYPGNFSGPVFFTMIGFAIGIPLLVLIIVIVVVRRKLHEIEQIRSGRAIVPNVGLMKGNEYNSSSGGLVMVQEYRQGTKKAHNPLNDPSAVSVQLPSILRNSNGASEATSSPHL
jgi:hypothetical protein